MSAGVGFVAIIPARYASTRFPGKPLIDIDGKPMIVRVAEQARRSRAARVVVATDDARIALACEAHRVEVVMTATTHPTGTDRLSEVASKLALPAETIVVNVQGDEPFIPPEAIDLVAATLAQHPTAGMATVGHPIAEREEFFNPNVVKLVQNLAGEAIYFSRAPIPYARDAFAADGTRSGALPAAAAKSALRHVGLYAYRAGFLKVFPTWPVGTLEAIEALEQLRALERGVVIAVAQIESALPPGIDTPEDYDKVKQSLSKN
jgi:3-deoxy-manno-octulosonate cytidylyltransferase (CMP-KDO synthetase)